MIGPKPADAVSLEVIESMTGTTLRRFSSDAEDPVNRLAVTPGLHRVRWDLRTAPIVIPAAAALQPTVLPGVAIVPGVYQVRLTAGNRALRQAISIRLDPRLRIAEADLRAQFTLAQSVQDKIREVLAAWRQATPATPARQRARRIGGRARRHVTHARPGGRTAVGGPAGVRDRGPRQGRCRARGAPLALHHDPSRTAPAVRGDASNLGPVSPLASRADILPACSPRPGSSPRRLHCSQRLRRRCRLNRTRAGIASPDRPIHRLFQNLATDLRRLPTIDSALHRRCGPRRRVRDSRPGPETVGLGARAGTNRLYARSGMSWVTAGCRQAAP